MSIEQSPINSFTRGGQFFNHFIRMAKDNLVRYVSVAILVAGVFGYFRWNSIADDHDKYVLTNELTYELILKVNPDLDKEVRLFRADGSETIIQMRHRMQDEIYARDVARSKSIFWAAFRYGLIFGSLVLLVVIIAAAWIGRALGTDKHQRGARLEDPKNVKNIITKWNHAEAKKMGLEDYEPYTLVDIPYPIRSETQHTMFVGSTGSGKTQAISMIVAQIKSRRHKAVMYDKMRSFIDRFFNPDKDIILNPLDKRSPAWDIFADARHIVDWENMAAAFIPEGEGDPIWHTTSRSVFAHTANRFVKHCQTHAKRPTIQALVDLLIKSTDEQLHEFLSGTIAATHINPQNSRTTGSIRTTLADAIRSLGYIKDPAPGETGFSIREWIKNDDQEGIIFLTSRDDIHPVLQPLITMWISVFTSALMSQPRSSSRLIWFILDELPTLNQLPGLERSLAEARQYGAAYLIGLQLISQLRDLYGHDKADSIVGLTRNKLVFNPGDPITAKVMSEFIGNKEILRREHGISIGAAELRDGQTVNSRVTSEAIILPEELSQLPGLNGVLKYTGDFPVCRVVLEYLDLSGEQPGYLEDPDAIDRADSMFQFAAPSQYTNPDGDPNTALEDSTPPLTQTADESGTLLKPDSNEPPVDPNEVLEDEEPDFSSMTSDELEEYLRRQTDGGGGVDNSLAKPKIADHEQHDKAAEDKTRCDKHEKDKDGDASRDLKRRQADQDKALEADHDDEIMRAEALLRPTRETSNHGHDGLPLHFGGR